VIGGIFTRPSLSGLELFGVTALRGAMLVLSTGAVIWADLRGAPGIGARLEGAVWRRWLVWLALGAAIVIFGGYGPGYDPQQFVYFKF
jgi:hypothetical protein